MNIYSILHTTTTTKPIRKNRKAKTKTKTKMHLSGKYISTLCLLVTGIYAQAGPSGSDTGNTLCLGSCADTKEELSCMGGGVATFREKKQCWLCCHNDDHLDKFADRTDDFVDHLEDVIPNRAAHV